MPRRKKKSLKVKVVEWLRLRPKVMAALAIFIICLSYLPVHAYHVYADNRKFHQTRAAMDQAYDSIAKSLGQPDNVKRSNFCYRASSLFSGAYTCTVETEFIYGIASQSQADIILKNIQHTLSATKLFGPTAKLSSGISDSLVFDTYYHGALDHFSGPHHIACTVKYSFDTPNEVDLSLNSPGGLPFEVFFTCSAAANHAVYPSR